MQTEEQKLKEEVISFLKEIVDDLNDLYPQIEEEVYDAIEANKQKIGRFIEKLNKE